MPITDILYQMSWFVSGQVKCSSLVYGLTELYFWLKVRPFKNNLYISNQNQSMEKKNKKPTHKKQDKQLIILQSPHTAGK